MCNSGSSPNSIISLLSSYLLKDGKYGVWKCWIGTKVIQSLCKKSGTRTWVFWTPRPCARCWMRYFCKMVLIDILTTQNACLLMASPTPDISFKMTFQAMGMAFFKEWTVCLTIVLGFKFSSSHLRPHSAEIDIFPKGFFHRAQNITVFTYTVAKRLSGPFCVHV